jgi:hypothetical protein
LIVTKNHYHRLANNIDIEFEHIIVSIWAAKYWEMIARAQTWLYVHFLYLGHSVSHL